MSSAAFNNNLFYPHLSGGQSCFTVSVWRHLHQIKLSKSLQWAFWSSSSERQPSPCLCPLFCKKCEVCAGWPGRGDWVSLHLHIGCRLQLLLWDWHLKHTDCALDVPACMYVCVCLYVCVCDKGQRIATSLWCRLSHHCCIKYKDKE